MGIKCVRCGADNDFKERTDNRGRCKSCNHPFAFEPIEMTYKFRFTDVFFAQVIEDISANSTLFFTEKQLFYLLDRRLYKRKGELYQSQLLRFIGCGGLAIALFLQYFYGAHKVEVPAFVWPLLAAGIIFLILDCYNASNSSTVSSRVRRWNARALQVMGILILALGIVFSLKANLFLLFFASSFLGCLSLYLGFRQLARQADIPQRFFINLGQFHDWMNRWQEINSPVGKMLPPAREERLPAEVSPELTAYSFDRAVICDSAAIAQLLIANNFHFENNCAVLSVTGYPQSIFSTVLEMLSRNPDLKVYALHDASPRGVGLAHHLRTSPNWFQNRNVIIYDLGLLPRQIFASRNVFIRASSEAAREALEMPVEVRQSLSASEIAWLEAGNFVELESFTPQKLIQVLNQGMAESQATTAIDVIDGGGGYLYAMDSFG